MNKKTWTKAVLPSLIALWFGGITSAYAGFINEMPPPTPVPAVQTAAVAPPATVAITELSAARVTEIGPRPSVLALAKGKGHHIALKDALSAVVPSDFRVETGNVDPATPVSWMGGFPWDVVINNATRPLDGVSIRYDWNRRTVTLHKNEASPLKAPVTQVTALATVEKKDSDATPAPFVPAPTPFVLLGGQSLGSQLMAWAKRAGWSVSWNTPDDWIVPHDKSFGTDFVTAINSVFSQLVENGADVRADVWKGNKAVVIDKAGVMQ